MWSVLQNNQNKPIDLLPQHISNRILDLEMEFDREDLNQGVALQLLSEYTKAVEYYEELGNPKYKLYQKRMKDFLKRPIVQSLLNGKTNINIQRLKKQEVLQNKLQKVNLQAKHEAKQLINRSLKSMSRQSNKIQESLKQQQNKLEQRIQRKRTSSQKTTNSSIKIIPNLDKQLQNIVIELQVRPSRNSRKLYI